MISVTNLTKRYGRFTAVDNVSFRVESGEAVALWGANGAGKTTILSCVLGLMHSRGMICLNGVDVRRHSKRARKLMGYVPQELSLYDDLRVGEAIAFFGTLRGARPNTKELLQRVGLHGQQRKRVGELSGGMKQRLALALALLDDPPVLVLDELTSSLDREAQYGFMDLLRDVKAHGTTILFTSHRIEEVNAIADRVIELAAGRIVNIRRPVAETPGSQPCTVKLLLAPSRLEEAVALLRTRGFETRRNGSGIFVDVEPAAKAEPIALLMRAEFEVRDFELNGKAHVRHHGEGGDA